jgi:hypothetical protein
VGGSRGAADSPLGKATGVGAAALVIYLWGRMLLTDARQGATP